MYTDSQLSSMARLGKARVPPLPVVTALTDRDDGTVWYVTHDSAQGLMGVTDTAPSFVAREGQRLYGANDGPCLGAGTLMRLFIRSGRLGCEVADLSRDQFDLDVPPVSSRDAFEHVAYSMIMPADFREPLEDELGWTAVLGPELEI